MASGEVAAAACAVDAASVVVFPEGRRLTRAGMAGVWKLASLNTSYSGSGTTFSFAASVTLRNEEDRGKGIVRYALKRDALAVIKPSTLGPCGHSPNI